MAWAIFACGCHGATSSGEAPHARSEAPLANTGSLATPTSGPIGSPSSASATPEAGTSDGSPEKVQNAPTAELVVLHDEAGQAAGVLSLPATLEGKHPFAVAVHKSYGRADTTCLAVREILGPKPFIVCPHTEPLPSTVASWKGPENLREELERSVAAARALYPTSWDEANPVYFGHSQGAMIAPIALSLPGNTNFVTAIFFEGMPPNPPSARIFMLRTPVKRLLLASGQGGWAPNHARFAASLAGSDIRAKHIHFGEVGHYLDARTIPLLRAEVPWALYGLSNW